MNVPSLHRVFEDYFAIGAAVNKNILQNQQELLKKHYNSLTAENDMKFESLQPQEGQFHFDFADELVSFAQAQGMQVRGHTLVWHNQTPSWVFAGADRNTLLARLETHISTVVARYRGRIASWDVVNEAIEDTEAYSLRKTPWLEIIGEDYIAKAFHFAHAADPAAQLFYNDYNESNPEKREKIYALVKSLLERGVPIHGVGLQAHWNLSRPSQDEIRAAIERYASLGLKLHITEMDVSVFDFEDRRTDLTEPTEQMQKLQEERYDQFFQLFREYKDVISNVTFWGAADDYTWLDYFPVQSRKNWPLLLDENHQPKRSFWRVTESNSSLAK